MVEQVKNGVNPNLLDRSRMLAQFQGWGPDRRARMPYISRETPRTSSAQAITVPRAPHARNLNEREAKEPESASWIWAGGTPRAALTTKTKQVVKPDDVRT